MFIAMQARLATGASTAQVNHWPSMQIFLRKDILLHRGLRPGPKYGWFSAHYLCIICFLKIENKKKTIAATANNNIIIWDDS